MTESGTTEAARIGAAVSAVIEQIFGTVAEVHTAALRAMSTARAAAPGPRLEERVRTLLEPGDQLAVGLGLIEAPRRDRPLRLHWWQVDPAADRLLALEPDLRPSSLGFYDYVSADWFDVPRRTGRRHVVGPYVDVHGTGRYLLTLTAPVATEGEFLGVVGADVPVSRFETHLLRALGPVGRPFLILSDEDRVVLSTSPRWLVGALVPAGGDLQEAGTPVSGVPWRLHLVDPVDTLGGT
jgi:hypothetical protein